MEAQLGGSAGSGGSNFAGDWDMSIGTGGGAAVMANDYNATHTYETIMASSTIVGGGTYRFAGSSSGITVIEEDVVDEPGVIVLTSLAHKAAAGDGICLVAVCNSSATSDDLLALFNGDAPANPVYGAAMQVDTYADQVRLVGFSGLALDTSNAWQAADYSGTSGIHGIRYYYDTGTAVSFWHPADDYVVDVAAITAAGQQLRLWVFCLPQSDMVNPTGFNYFLYDNGPWSFSLVSDAILPDGATDGDWYRVTGAGTFAGVDTVIGDYVKLIDGMTDIIAVHYGADGAQGPQGDPGPAGADGAPGADGAQGDPGPAGADGASAYDVAVANGFVGDEAAWLAGLVGPTGATGATGAQGDTGATGATGVNIVTEFTGSADFTINANTQFLRVILIGGGGGGGAGGTSGAGVACTGGAGGGGAGKRELVLTRAEVLAAYPTGVVPVGIAAGGTAGASVTNAGAQNGNTGGQGGNTTFGTIATAYGGGAGSAGGGSAAASVGGGGGSQRAKGTAASPLAAYGAGGGGNGSAPAGVSSVGCGSGGSGCSAAAAASAGVYACDGGVGGASGGGVTSANAATNGADGGPRFMETTGAAAGTGGVTGSAGTAGAAPAAGGLFGQGGGGGGGGSAGAGGAGGAGGRGSGGGGGAGCRSTYATGAGGVGGDGWALVLEF